MRRPWAVPLLVALLAATTWNTAVAQSERVALAGHVPQALGSATRIAATPADAATAVLQPVTLTVVLKRTDPQGFAQFLADVYDPKSAQRGHFLSAAQLADRFGPSPSEYDLVRSYFTSHGFNVAEDSANRLTLTVSGTRAMAQAALGVAITDYRIPTANGLAMREFYAIASDPTLPAAVAAHVQAVIGLSDLARPDVYPRALKQLVNNAKNCASQTDLAKGAPAALLCGIVYFFLAITYDLMCATHFGLDCTMYPPVPGVSTATAGGVSTLGLGTGQKIGIVAFDSFHVSDVSDFLAMAALPAAQIGQLTSVAVNGGAPIGANESEVLLDIATVMRLAPGADVVVYSAPFSGAYTSFQALFNRMVVDGMTVVSNSWAYCEDQTTLADVQSIDAVLATAAAAGISVFNGSGDSGSTCLDGQPGTIAVPADAPHATAVGGTSVTYGPGGAWVSETWWNGAAGMPPTGQGGFGTSRFFSRPAYQDGHTASPMRSIPDLAVNADPVAAGAAICQADAGGCPTGLSYGGTSFSAPQMAAYVALLNQARGSNLGLLNGQVYPLAGTTAFHSPASMGSDFAHVGLGSPNFSFLNLALQGRVPGPPSAVTSSVVAAVDSVPADGSSTTSIVVQLRDADGSAVSGKTVTLAPVPAGTVVIAPSSGVSSTGNGTVVFTVSDTVAQTVTFTATDVTDGLVLSSATVTFRAPPAAGGSIGAAPTTVANDGVAHTTITVTLRDALNQPTAGKRVALAQGGGHSVINGPNPSVTDAGGSVQFTASDQYPETVTYTALDVTDGNLPVPGSAVVTFGGQGNASCVGPPPAAAAGFTLTPFITGFPTGILSFGNVNYGCTGATLPGFAADGSAYVNNFLDGSVYKLPPQGGAATSGTRLGTVGPALHEPVIGRDGRIYAARAATTGDYYTGAILELNPVTGAVVRTVLGSLLCPSALAVDPLSGDLFYDDPCFGGFPPSNDQNVYRVHNPASATPTLSIYTTLPSSPNSWLGFAPDGTLFVAQSVSGSGAPVLRISGTNVPGVPTQTPVPGLATIFWTTVGEVLPNGAAKSLVVLDAPSPPTRPVATVRLADITTNPPTFTDLLDGPFGTGTVGPDGCLYISGGDTIYKLAPSAGGCGFAPTSRPPKLALAPVVAAPSPTQGTQQTLTAQFVDIAVPANTPVLFTITGANTQVRLGRTDANGAAVIAYTGTFTGTDHIVATATVGPTALTSNTATATWTAGVHVSALSLNATANGAKPGQAVVLSAALVDVSADPAAAIVGATVHFTVGAQACDGVTDATGRATCSLTPAAAGTFTLAVSFAGNPQHLPANASQQFFVTAGGVQRAFVASYGSDASNCARQSPCRTFAEAIAHLSSGGEVLVIDSAGYGPVAVTQPVAIVAPPGVYAGITAFAGPAIIVASGTGSVTLRGLALNSLGGDVGIDFRSGDALYVDRVTISAFPVAGLRTAMTAAASVHVRNSVLRGNGIGASFSPPAAAGALAVEVDDSLFEDNATGIAFAGGSVTGTVRSSVVTGGAKGVVVAPGVAGATVSVQLRNATLAANTGSGAEVGAGLGTAGMLAVVRSQLSGNGMGLDVRAGGTAVATGSDIARNGQGVAITGGGVAVSSGDNRLHDNTANGAFSSTVPKQ